MEENLELNNNTNWNDILVLIDKNKFLSTYTNYSLTNRENGYLIESAKKEDHQTIFLLKKKRVSKYILMIIIIKQLMSSQIWR